MSGLLVLMGGDEFRPNCVPMDRELLRGLGPDSPRVLVLPTAAAGQRPELAARNGVRYFEGLGARAAAAMVVAEADARDPAHVASLQEADLIYLAGGDPWYLLRCLQGSPLVEALRDVWRRGAAVAGSSAGAMVLAGKMRSRTAGEWADALGFAPGLAVLPHHERFSAGSPPKAPDPSTVLLGIDSATACVSLGTGTWRAVGSGAVTVYSGGKASRYTAGGQFALP